MDFLPNIAIPLSVFLIPVGFFFLVFLIYSLFNMYHLLRFGVYGFGLYSLVSLYALGTIFLLLASFYLILQFDWTLTLSVDTFVDGYQSENFLQF